MCLVLKNGEWVAGYVEDIVELRKEFRVADCVNEFAKNETDRKMEARSSTTE